MEPSAVRLRFLWASFLALWLFTQGFYGAVAPWSIAVTLLGLTLLNVLAMVLLPGGLKLSRVTTGFLIAIGSVFLIQLLPTAPLFFPRTHEMRGLHGVGSLWPGTADAFLTLRCLAQVAIYVLSALLALKLRAEGLSGTGMMKGLGFVLILQAGYAIVQDLAGLKEIPFYGPRLLLTSASGTFVNANTFAGVMAMGLVVAAALAYSRFAWSGRGSSERRVESGVLWALAAGLLAFGLVLSRSRGGAISAAAGLLAIPLLHRGRASVGGALLILALGGVGAGLANPTVRLSRFEELGASDVRENHRVKIWSTTWTASTAQPVLGWGVGTHRYAYHPYQPPTLVGQIDHAHNEFLNFFFEGGAIFFLIMIAGLAAWGWRSWRALQRLSLPERFLPTAAIAAVLCEAVHSVVDMDCRVTSAGMLLATLLALGAAAIRPKVEPGIKTWGPSVAAGGIAAILLLILPLDPHRVLAAASGGDARAAEKALQRALGLSPFQNQAAWFMARWSEIHEDAPRADRRYARAADLWPAHPELQRDVAAYFWNRWKGSADSSHYDRAARSFHRLFVQQPSAVVEVMTEIWNPGKPPEEYEGLLPKDSPAAWGALAEFLVASGELKRGMDVFQRGVPASAEQARVYDAFASRLGKGSHWGPEAVVRDRRLAFKSDPAAHAEAARAWARLEAWDHALERVQFACRSEPANATWLALKGDILRGKGDREAALEAYVAAIQRAPLDLQHLHRRATLYLEMKLPAEAAADFKLLLRANPGDRSTTLSLVRALAASGDHAGARRLLDDYLSRNPRDPEAEALRKSLHP